MTKELAIRTCGLTKQFDRHIAVNDVDLQIQSGEVYGLIGPNGAGKTTLIRMLAAAEEPTVGEIYLNGDRATDCINPNASTNLGCWHIKRSNRIAYVYFYLAITPWY